MKAHDRHAPYWAAALVLVTFAATLAFAVSHPAARAGLALIGAAAAGSPAATTRRVYVTTVHGGVAAVDALRSYVYVSACTFTDLADLEGYPGPTGLLNLNQAFDFNDNRMIALHAGDQNFGDIYVCDLDAGTFEKITKKERLKIEKEIAKLVGVSQQTVARALLGRPDISAEMRQRILSIAQKNGYRPSAAARAIRGTATKHVGVIVATTDVDIGKDHGQYDDDREEDFHAQVVLVSSDQRRADGGTDAQQIHRQQGQSGQ
mgnify:CR=1 FL=1